jgi:hypothetical protein
LGGPQIVWTGCSGSPLCTPVLNVLMCAVLIYAVPRCVVLCFAVQAIVYQVVEQRGSPHGWNWVFHISDLFRCVATCMFNASSPA